MIANILATYRDGHQEIGTMEGPFRAVVSHTGPDVTWVVVNSPRESVSVPVRGTLEMWVTDEL
jgi:hypothetical protein